MRKRRSGPERPTYRPPAAEVGRPRRDRRRMGQRFAAAPPISRFPFFWTCKVSGFGYLPRDFSTRGRSSTWLERRLVTPKVAGSSPVDPATGKPNLRAIGGFSLRGRGPGPSRPPAVAAGAGIATLALASYDDRNDGAFPTPPPAAGVGMAERPWIVGHFDDGAFPTTPPAAGVGMAERPWIVGHFDDGAWLSLVERKVWDLDVAGSNPAAPIPFLMHDVYIIYSPSLDRFYVGESADATQRLEHHRTGHQRFTRRATDWVMVFCRPASSRSEALGIEQTIKRSKSRKSIIRWIHGPDNQVEASTWQHLLAH